MKTLLLLAFLSFLSSTSSWLVTVAAFRPATPSVMKIGGSSRRDRTLLSVSRLPLNIDEDDQNREAISTTKFAWEKEKPKQSLTEFGTSHTAVPWILNVVEASHWSLFLPTFAASYAVVSHLDTWQQAFGDDGDTSLRLCLWILAPVVQAFAGLPPIVAHIYED